MRKMIVKADMGENPKPSGKTRKEYIKPTSSMVIKRGIFGEDLGKNKKWLRLTPYWHGEKYIDTDMNGSENVGNIAQGLAGGDIANTAPPEFQIERLQRMLRAYEESERSNAVAVRSQVVLTLFPLLVQYGTSVEEGISHAARISKFILDGEVPFQLEKLEVAPSAGK